MNKIVKELGGMMIMMGALAAFLALHIYILTH